MKTEQQVTRPTQQEIAAYAFQLWESEGRQPGRDLDYWLQAEAQLTADRKADAAVPTAAKAPEAKPVEAPKTPAPAPAPAPAPILSRVEPPKSAAPDSAKKSPKSKKKSFGK